MFSVVLNHYSPPGTIVWIRAYVVYRHRGLVSDRRYGQKPMVISNSSQHGVVEQLWDEFREGQDVQIEGYPGILPSEEVLKRARSRLGMSYNIGGFNCDHLVNEAHGLPVKSEQLNRTLAVAALFSFLMAGAVR